MDRSGLLCVYPTGSGKTRTMLCTINELFKQGVVDYKIGRAHV